MTRKLIACAAVLLGFAASSSAQNVSLQFDNGRVNLTAQDAPVRTILAEWARLGGTRIINGDRVTGAPVTLELKGVSERQALETLLRNVAGYVVTPRGETAGTSVFGGVMILATSTAPRTAPPVTFSAAPVQQRQVIVEDDQDPDPSPPTPRVNANPFTPTPGVAGAGPVIVRPAVTPALPNGQDPAPAQPPVQRPSTSVTTLPGTSRPGEITPVPQQQPPQQQQPNQR